MLFCDLNIAATQISDLWGNVRSALGSDAGAPAIVGRRFAGDRVDNNGRSGIIKAKNSELENGLPIKGSPSSTVDKTDDNGKVLQRRIYGPDGRAKIDFDTTDHGFPYKHPTGAHKHELDLSKKNPHGDPLPLTEQELEENSDIIKRGVNYHD